MQVSGDKYPNTGVILAQATGEISYMVRELCSQSASPRKYGQSSTTKGFSTTSLMRIMALLGDRLGDSLYTNREKIEISQVFIEI